MDVLDLALAVAAPGMLGLYLISQGMGMRSSASRLMESLPVVKAVAPVVLIYSGAL